MTDDDLVIAFSDLREATRLIVAASDRFGPSVDLDADLYWLIARELDADDLLGR